MAEQFGAKWDLEDVLVATWVNGWRLDTRKQLVLLSSRNIVLPKRENKLVGLPVQVNI